MLFTKRKPQKKKTAAKKLSLSRRASPRRIGVVKGGASVAGSIYCADFVGRNQHNVTCGYTAGRSQEAAEAVERWANDELPSGNWAVFTRRTEVLPA